MDHLAIMSQKIPFLQRIVSGEKSIESRWYQHKYLPWGRITNGDTVYFKNSGQLVSVKAKVKRVMQFICNDEDDVRQILNKNYLALGLYEHEKERFADSIKNKRYVIFLYLSAVTAIPPFAISKKGFGTMAAWITVPDINQIKLGLPQ